MQQITVLLLLLFFKSGVFSHYITSSPLERNGLGPEGHEGDKLLMVKAIWRHGDRAPLNFFETAEQKKPDWPVPGGFLSPLGEEQQKELGLWIRRRYVEHFKLLDTVVHSKAMKIFSTDKNRTVQSAKFNLFGMYGLNVVGVPIQIRDKSKDFYGVPADSCDRLKSLLGLLKTTFEYKALDTQNRDLFRKLKKIVKKPADIKYSPATISKIWDTLFLQRLHNKKTDSKVNALYQEIDNLYNYYHNIAYGYNLAPIRDNNGKEFDIGFELKRAWGGYLLEKTIEELKDHLTCKNNIQCALKYSAQSTHETTIAGFLAALGMPMMDYDRVRLPDLCSAVFLELWQNGEDKSNYVKLIYRRNSTNILDITDGISGCHLINERGCLFDSFVKRSENFIPGTDKQLCLRKMENDPNYNFASRK